MTLNYTTKEIEKIIKPLKSKNAHWYAEIPKKILKASTPFILFSLTYICNKSLSSGIFPSRLKCSETKPLYKKGERTKITNFRPISLLYNLFKCSGKSYIYKIIPTHQPK
jgi:hypothetical protein